MNWYSKALWDMTESVNGTAHPTANPQLHWQLIPFPSAPPLFPSLQTKVRLGCIRHFSAFMCL